MKSLRSICPILLICLIGGSSAPAALKSTKVPRFDSAVAKAVGYLEANAAKASERDKTLMAYAILKAMKPEDGPKHPLVREGLAIAKGRALAKAYQGYDHIYLAGVDAMLLADTDGDLYFNELQQIADYVTGALRADGSWSDSPRAPGDISMSQYGILALWAAQRAGCKVPPDSIDRSAAFFLKGRNRDSGWGYRPGTKEGPGAGLSTHNMTLAGAGTVAVARTMLHGPKGLKAEVKVEEEAPKFGILEKVKSAGEAAGRAGAAFPGYSPKNAMASLDDAVNRGISWNDARFNAVSDAAHKIYFYYALERASALADLKEGWFTTYGDGLLTLQGKEGEFATHSGPNVGTSLAVLYFMRSTKQIIEKQFGKGVMKGARGLDNLFGGKDKKKKELGPLDELLGGIMSSVEKLEGLDEINTDDIVEKVKFTSRDELVGQVDMLKQLLKSKDADARRTAYWALGRTGDFALIPMMMQGLRDPSVDCNVEALSSLRYIARKPNGFELSTEPLAGAETAAPERRVEVANAWRTKAYKVWGNWYRQVRPFTEGDGLDELELTSQGRGR